MKKIKILFVDDDQNILTGIKRNLRIKKDEWELFFALSGKEALEKCEKDDFDLIITDGKMPLMSGTELLIKLKSIEKTKEIPTIMLTGHVDDDAKQKALENGIVEFLQKPIKPAELILRIQNVLRLKQISDNLKVKNSLLEKLNDDLRIANQKIVEENKKNIELEKKNSVFAMVVTANHELNQPLTVLSAAYDMFKLLTKKVKFDEKPKMFLNKISDALSRIQDILKKYRTTDSIEFIDYAEKIKMVHFKEKENFMEDNDGKN